jgi:hypothetical protein
LHRGAALLTIFGMMFDDPRRMNPRIALDGLCGVVTDRDMRHAALVDVSSTGIRIEHPFDPAVARDAIQLEIELPGVDDVLWAHGHVAFAHLRPMGGCHANGQPRFWCRAGIHIDRAAARDLRRMRDYVDAFLPRWDVLAPLATARRARSRRRRGWHRAAT